MAAENHTRIVSIPYPGRDLAIFSLIVSLLLPVFGPLIGFLAARRSLAEAENRGYSQIGIQRFAYGLSGFLLLLELILVAVIVFFTDFSGIVSSFFPPPVVD